MTLNWWYICFLPSNLSYLPKHKVKKGKLVMLAFFLLTRLRPWLDYVCSVHSIHCALTNHHLAFLGEVVLWDLQVERRRSLSYAARNVVVGAVAGAEPAAEVAGLANGDTSEMSADT